MTSLIGITADLRAVLAAHVALELVDRRRLRPTDDVQGDGLMRVAAETAHLEVAVAGVERVTGASGRAGAGPLKPSMRLFQASQASLSA